MFCSLFQKVYECISDKWVVFIQFGKSHDRIAPQYEYILFIYFILLVTVE